MICDTIRDLLAIHEKSILHISVSCGVQAILPACNYWPRLPASARKGPKSSIGWLAEWSKMGRIPAETNVATMTDMRCCTVAKRVYELTSNGFASHYICHCCI